MIAGEQTAGSTLLDSIRVSAGDYEVVDLSSRQFPCYSMGSLYEEDNSGDLNRRTLVMFTIPLLCNCYTYYIHDFYRVLSQTAIAQCRKVYPIDSVSLENHVVFGNMKPVIERIALEIEKFFPEHRYVNHIQLFNNGVAGAVPYSKTVDDIHTHPYSIYHFLFDGFFAENPFVMP
ncbi:hypothetical protein SAMN04488128_103311 [Chitinophaga eiseniae]|uniref:Uncharacterized protein n=2 Tax=Chitinophaga eiseniae TaxID=634771 RepID=A0A1T4SRN7_9BACT|nr:hypothetical protein SAMN04488128_103311 [Chitinophaga eiseniae]